MTHRAVLERQLEEVFRAPPQDLRPVAGAGHGAMLYRFVMRGRDLLAKTAPSHLSSEGQGLRRLAAAGLPVPHVHHAEDRLLVMDYVRNDGSVLSQEGCEAAAEMIATLHDTHGSLYGLDEDGMLGGLVQLNEAMPQWREFFRHKRLVHAAWLAFRDGRIAKSVFQRTERIAADVARWIDEPPAPCLLHGDLWSGNVLTYRGNIAAFIDPAPYFGHPEIEIAFSTLFTPLPDAFYARYFALRPSAAGFEQRRALYLLYPLLVHAALFGSPYDREAEAIVARFGY